MAKKKKKIDYAEAYNIVIHGYRTGGKYTLKEFLDAKTVLDTNRALAKKEFDIKYVKGM